MKKNHVLIASCVLALIGLGSAPLAAQPSSETSSTSSEANAKSDADLASEIAVLRKRIRRLELEQQDAKLHDQVRRLESEKPARSTSADASAAAELLPPVAAAPALGYAAEPRLYNAMPRTVAGGGFYFWIDGLYDRLNLPNDAGAIHNTDAGFISDQGATQSFDPRLNAGGVRGAVGYAISPDFRFEVGGSYIAGSGSLQNSVLPSTPSINVVLLNGFNNLGAFCACSVNGTLRTNYDAWKVFAEAKYDAWRSGPLTLTATAALFGGTSDANQDLTQTYLASLTAGTYSSHTSLRWTDVGGRLGLDANYAINPLFSVGLKGWAGAAGRETSLSGNDLDVNNATGPVPSLITSSATTAAFLANVEGSFTHSVTSSLSVRGFAGFNYDNKVPGVRSSTSLNGMPIQAGVFYASEFDYYAGIGLNVKFGNIEYIR